MRISQSFADLPVSVNMKFPMRNSFAERPEDEDSPMEKGDKPVNNRYKQLPTLEKNTELPSEAVGTTFMSSKQPTLATSKPPAVAPKPAPTISMDKPKVTAVKSTPKFALPTDAKAETPKVLSVKSSVKKGP
jgi:hypothetical protein